jgi:hypothetical protein
VRGQSAASAWSPRRARQLTRHGELAGASPELERRQGFHPGHPHGSIYEPQHPRLEEGARQGVLTSEAVRVAATNGVEGGNDFKVEEDAPSLPSELHTSVTDIRQCLTGDEKHENESSPAAADVARVIHGGGQGSGPMIPKPRAKGAQGSEDHLCKRNCPMAGPIGG